MRFIRNTKVSLENLKLSRQLIAAMQEAGFEEGTEVQQKVLSRIHGGQNLVVTAPEDSGKTTAYVLGVLMKLSYSTDEAPKALVLVPDEERALEVIAQFRSLGRNKNLRVTGLYGKGGMEEEINELMHGTDIVVATPNRARTIYLKLALNMNRIKMFIVDDASEMIGLNMQVPLFELARSAGKVQQLVFTREMTGKLQKLLDRFMEFPAVITF